MSVWSITVSSKRNLSDADRDFIAELISEVPRSVTKPYYFTLHDIVESKKYSQLFVEGTKTAINNLISVLRDNLPYKIPGITLRLTENRKSGKNS